VLSIIHTLETITSCPRRFHKQTHPALTPTPSPASDSQTPINSPNTMRYVSLQSVYSYLLSVRSLFLSMYMFHLHILICFHARPTGQLSHLLCHEMCVRGDEPTLAKANRTSDDRTDVGCDSSTTSSSSSNRMQSTVVSQTGTSASASSNGTHRISTPSFALQRMLSEERIDGVYLSGQCSKERANHAIARSAIVLDQLQQAFSTQRRGQ